MKNICFYPLHSAPSSEEEYVTLESQADRDLSLPDIWEPVASQSRRRGLLILTGKISIIEIPVSYTHLDVYKRQVQEGAVEKPLRDYSVSEQAAILCAYGDLTEDDEGEEFPEE